MEKTDWKKNEKSLYLPGTMLRRQSHSHREIYLSDFRKTAPAALRTVLRVGVVPA
jgi:hypothetical protein